ncbi:MAG TPA: tetratricopeptide repeat protein [Kofleriaceae bacterium]
MTARATALVCIALVGGARADTPEGPKPLPPDLRRAYEQGDFETVRRELLKAYAVEPRTEYLFALGQVELNLENYESAIRYYEQFIARRPTDEQIALAQQAIGAARTRLEESKRKPPPPPPPPPVDAPKPTPLPPRQWYAEDTGFVALGGAAMLVGAGLLYYSHTLGEDREGTLSQYHQRVELSRTTQWTGVGVAAGGALVIGLTVLRWRLRPDGGTLAASVAPGSGTFVFIGRW